MDYLAWYNLVFELPFIGGFLLALLLVLGTFGEGGHGHVGHGGDVSHHVDMGHVHHDFGHHDIGHHDLGHHDLGHGEAGHGTHGSNENSESSSISQLLTFLGVGKVPLTIILVAFFVVWGFTGFACNLVFGSIIPFPGLYLWLSAVVATIIASFLTRYLSIGLSNLVPSMETFGVSKEQLVGLKGVASYDISETFGEANVEDRVGNNHMVNCRIRQGAEKIKAGTTVVLFEYRPEEEVFIVVTEDQLDTILAQKS